MARMASEIGHCYADLKVLQDFFMNKEHWKVRAVASSFKEECDRELMLRLLKESTPEKRRKITEAVAAELSRLHKERYDFGQLGLDPLERFNILTGLLKSIAEHFKAPLPNFELPRTRNVSYQPLRFDEFFTGL